MAVVNRNQGTPVFLAPPSTLAGNPPPQTTNTAPTNSSLSQSDNFTGSIVPNNYPQVSNNIPASIFPQQNTTVQTQGTPAAIPSTQTTATGTTSGTLKPITMTEAQWAVKFEDKVKQGYKPSDQEMAKYQDIVARFKANPKVDSSILELLAAQSSSLGAQVASMRYGSNVSTALRGLKPGAGASMSSGISAAEDGAVVGGVGASLKGLGTSLLKGSGLSAIVSGGFSLITNGIQVLQGKKTWADVSGTVAADTANGAISGVTGTLGAGLAGLLIGGATGLLPTLVIGAGAMGGAWLGDKLFRGTGMYDKLKDKVSGMFQPSQPQTYQPQFNNTTIGK